MQVREAFADEMTSSRERGAMQLPERAILQPQWRTSAEKGRARGQFWTRHASEKLQRGRGLQRVGGRSSSSTQTTSEVCAHHRVGNKGKGSTGQRTGKRTRDPEKGAMKQNRTRRECYTRSEGGILRRVTSGRSKATGWPIWSTVDYVKGHLGEGWSRPGAGSTENWGETLDRSLGE